MKIWHAMLKVNLIFLLALTFMLGLNASASGTPKATGNTFRAIYPKAPKSLDPHQFPPDPASWPIVMAAYHRLMTLEPGTGEIAPALAKTMRVSDDGLIYTFILNEGLTFTDGRLVDSEAALFSFDRLMSTEVGRLYFEPLERMEIVGPYTFRLMLKSPWPPFAFALTMPQASLISPGLAHKPADYLMHKTLGSGRYEVYDWQDKTIGLRIRDDMVSKPDISFAMYHFEENAAKRYEKMTKYSAHLTIDPQLPQDQLAENLSLKKIPAFSVCYLAFNCQRPYTKMKSVRRALSQVLMAAFNEKPLNGPFPPGLFGRNLSHTNLQVDGFENKSATQVALEALQQVGPPPGPLTLVFKSDEPQLRSDAKKIADALTPYKIAVNLTPLEGAAGKKIMEEGDYDFFLDTRRADLPSAEMWLGRFMDSRSSRNGNPSLFKNSEADALVDDITLTLSGRERQEKVARLAELCLDESPYAFLYQLEKNIVVDRRLEKLEPHPMWPEVWPLDQSSLKPLLTRSGANPQGKQPPKENEKTTVSGAVNKNTGKLNEAPGATLQSPEVPAAPQPEVSLPTAPALQANPGSPALPAPLNIEKPTVDEIFEPHLTEPSAPVEPLPQKVPPPPAIVP